MSFRFRNTNFEVSEGSLEFVDGLRKHTEVKELWASSPSGAKVLKGGESEGELLVYEIEYLVVAGGGGFDGDSPNGFGGGGAGGYLEGRAELVTSVSYDVYVGAGGADARGNDTRLGDVVEVTGGGRGGDERPGSNGGSGGGGIATVRPGAHSGGLGIEGQGYAGGSSYYNVNINHVGGGGGGAGGPGQAYQGTAAVATGGRGGDGKSSNITGIAVTRAGGGGGGVYSGHPNVGGSGGGGNGGIGIGSTVATSGAVNSGGGGGGGARGHTTSGGSGIVILRYPGPQRGTGGTVTQANGYTIHTFTTSGTFTA